MNKSTRFTSFLFSSASMLIPVATAAEPTPYFVCVSNERSGDVSVIDGAAGKVVATIRAGKRPRGIHASPDGGTLYVALSGSPIAGPPKLDARGVPIAEDEADEDADHAEDGIGVLDLRRLTLTKRLSSGSDPEEFAVSRDGTKLYISNEDVATASVVNVADGKVEALVRVKQEPEGVALSPDGLRVFVTCEAGGEVVVVDATRAKAVAEFHVGGRPRTVAFLPDGSRFFIPSETAGTLTVFDGASYRPLGVIKLPQGSRPMGTALDSTRNRLYVSTGRAGTVCVVDLATGGVLDAIPAGARPWGLGLAPDGKRLYVANGPSDDVSVIDPEARKEVARIKVGTGPWGIAVVAAPH